MQHIRQTHRNENTENMAATIENWKRPSPPDQSELHCGFCGVTLISWAEKCDHVARHYKQGAEPWDWWPERKQNQIPSQLEPSEAYVSL
jgi:hypothetical protein